MMKPLAQQTILITGSTDGLGKQTALALARQGATVLLHGRNQQRLDKTLRDIQDMTGNRHLETYLADLADLSEVRSLAERVQTHHPQLTLLINNAGVGSGKLLGGRRELSRDGYELRFAVNYLSPFLLTHLLLSSLRHGSPARIIHVGSVGQLPIDFDNIMFERRYNGYDAYRRSKLALVMFTIDLADLLKDEQVTVNCVHPASLMNTKMVRETIPFSQTTVEEGVRSVMYLATSPALDHVTGKYFDQLQEARAHPQAYDPAARLRLRQISEQLTGLADSKASQVG